jgi:uncharacterized damage-inducible protein DinB
MDIRTHSTSIIRQLSQLLTQLSEEQFIQPLSCMAQNSIGKHVRHVIECYQCLFQGIEIDLVDYDKRERNIRIETDKVFALQILEALSIAIMNLEEKLIQLQVTYSDNSTLVQTSVKRELAYNVEHTVHHLAIIKMGINVAFPSVEIPENVGVASSTLRYQSQLSEKKKHLSIKNY